MRNKLNISIRAWFAKKHVIFWVLILGIIILLPVFIGGAYKYFRLAKEIEVPVLRIQTVRVKEAPMPEIIETIGIFTADKELNVKAVSRGKIQDLLVKEGVWVQAGTLLANIVPGIEVRAPFDGYLSCWMVKPGEIVAEGTNLVNIVNPNRLSLTYRVPESVAGKLDLGQTVKVSIKAAPNKQYEGVVEFISPVVDRKTYTILIKTSIKNPNQDLKPGMSAYVKHILTSHPNALVVPEFCVILTVSGYEAFVISDGKVQIRKIQIGEKTNGRVRIVAGLNLGEPVVMTRTFMVREGIPAIAEDWTRDW